MLRLQAELETSEQVQRDFVRLSQALQVWHVPHHQATVTPGDMSWVMQGQSPARGVLFLLLGWRGSFLSYCSRTLKLCVHLCRVGSPGPGTQCAACPLSPALPGPPFLDPGLMGWGRWGYICPPRASACLPGLQVRLEQIRQAESLEQVRSLLDKAPLRDIGDVKDS